MKNKARLPKMGQPVRGSKTGRPIMVALDLLGRRGCLRVLWELREKSLTFRLLQAAAATNPALLNTRLKELRVAGLVEHGDAGYGLTNRGRELEQVLESLSEWANRWSEELERGES
jgi:DNA-binding HxlR family transcriptional regulator